MPVSVATTSLNPATICRQSSAAELGVEHRADLELMVLDQLLEMMVLDAEHDLPVHLQKAAIAVIGEALVAALPRQTLHGLVVEAEIEHGVHHARHRGARPGAHRDQQRPLGIAESGADRLLDAGKRRGDLRLQIGRIAPAVGVEMGADLGRDREPGRHRQAEIAHFGEVGALAAEQVAHLGPPLGARRGQNGRPISPWAFSPLELSAAPSRRSQLRDAMSA